MLFKQSAAVLALFLASGSNAIRTYTEEDMPFFVVERDGPKEYLVRANSFSPSPDVEEESEVVPIALALRGHGRRHQRPQSLHQSTPMFFQPSDFSSREGPGVIFMPRPSRFENPSDFASQEGPGVIFMREQPRIAPAFENPTVFMIAAPAEQAAPPKPSASQKEAPKPATPKQEVPKQEKAAPKSEPSFFDDGFAFDFDKNMRNMEKEMDKRMNDVQKHFREQFDHDFGHFEKAKPIVTKEDNTKPIDNNKLKSSNLTNIEAGNNKTEAAAGDKNSRSISTNREYSSSEFSDSETTTEYDAKTDTYNVEKCVNGKCDKFTQYKNGTTVAQTPEPAKPAAPENKIAIVAAPAAPAAAAPAKPAAANLTQAAKPVAANSTQALSHVSVKDDAKDKEKEKTPEEKEKEEKEKKEKETEEKLKELEKIKAEQEAKRLAAEAAAKLKKKQEDIKRINDELANDEKVKTANEKKAFWKAKAAAIKNATEMEKEEKEQDEKDYQEMKKAIPGVTARVIGKVKDDVQADKDAQNARIKAWNKKVLRSHPNYRAPEPKKKEEDKDPSKADSDAAVEEMKALRKKNATNSTGELEREDALKTMTAQLTQKKENAESGKTYTDKKGDAHIHFAQQEAAPAQNTTANATAEAAPTLDFKGHPTTGAITLNQRK